MKLKLPRFDPALVRPYLDRWQQLEQRERWLIGTAVGLLGFLILYGAIWQPIMQARTDRAAALAAARNLATRMEAAGTQAQGARSGVASGQSLLALVDQSSRAALAGKTPTRIQPDGERTVRVWLDDIAFDALLRWLNELQGRYGVIVESAEIEGQATPGLVKARLAFVKP